MAARYKIVEEIGRGAMGRVYRAYDSLLERDVALKELIAPEYLKEEEKEEVRERFRQEARAAARLTHPHILTVHDILASGGRQFIVMEYLEGKTLRDVLSERIFSAEEVLSIAPMISDALNYAHSQGIIHRDVKPDNIFVLESGNIKVADFGIAKMLKVKDMTQTGVIMGTPNYIAPELVKGLDYDHRMDIFSLGVTLYELLAGRRPFDADTDYAVIYKVASEEPVPLNEIRDDLPPDLVEIIQRALLKDPGQRYADMGALKESLMLVRAELGMDVPRKKGKPFDKDEALHQELEAARDAEGYEPESEEQPANGFGFHRDKGWQERIARIYRAEKAEEAEAGTIRLADGRNLETVVNEAASPRRVQPVKPSAPGGRGAGSAAARQPAARGLHAASTAGEVGEKAGLYDPEATIRWSGLVIGAGVLTVLSIFLPWIAKPMRTTSLYGYSFPEGMVLTALIALVLGADAMLLLRIGDAGIWVKTMKVLSVLGMISVLAFLLLRVVLGLGVNVAEGIGALDRLKSVGWGAWLALVCSAITIFGCGRTEKASQPIG